MATIINMASTAKKCAKKGAKRMTQNQAIILALASMALAQGADEAARAAISDMAQEEAQNIQVNYTGIPSTGCWRRLLWGCPVGQKLETIGFAEKFSKN